MHDMRNMHAKSMRDKGGAASAMHARACSPGRGAAVRYA